MKMNLSKTTLRWSSVMLFLLISFCATVQANVEITADAKVNPQTNVLEVDFNAKNFDEILSMQFSIQWNPVQLSFSEVNNIGLPDLISSNFGTSNNSSGVVTVSWFDPTVSGVSLNDCTTLFTLYFDTYTTTNPTIGITNNPTTIELTDINGNLVNLFFNNGQCTGGSGNGDVVAICNSLTFVSLGAGTPPEATISADILDNGSYCLCNEDLTFSFSADVFDQTKTFNCDDLGDHLVQMWVTNESGDQNFCTVSIFVEDKLTLCPSSSEPPYAACEDLFIEEPVGCVTVNATDFDAGSWDDNDQKFYLIAKANDSFSQDEFNRCYYPSIEYCDNEDDDLEVYFIVLDQDPAPYFETFTSPALGCNGDAGLFLTNGFTVINYDICKAKIKICDSPVPIALTCPSNENVTCDDFAGNLEILLASLAGNSAAQNHALNATFGQPEFELPCDFGIDHEVTVDLDQCLQGNIVRNWTAVDLNDPNGNSAWCSQIIFLHHISDFVVEFPEDKTLPFGTAVDAASVGQPQVSNETCELVATTYQDQVFTNIPGLDAQIIREWTVINWCTVGNDINQEIVEVPENVLASPNNDLDGDGDSDDRTFRDSWDGSTYPGDIGDTWDGYITYTQTIDIEEPGNNAVVPYCKAGLIVEIMQTGAIEIWATDIDAGSFCTAGGDVSVSFSPDVNDISKVFTCDELGDNVIDMWATCNATGAQDFCTTVITIQDNMSLCDQPSGDISINGNISKVDGSPMANTTVTCFFGGFNVNAQTNADGDYEFIDLPSGETFTITAESDINPEEGVTIYDIAKGRCQILWVDFLQAAASFIALDVNGTGGASTFDLVMMEKIILGEPISFDYPIWQFVSNLDQLPADFNAYSLQQQSIVLPNLTNNVVGQDFTAVKTGDLVPEINPVALSPIFDLEDQAPNGQEVTVDLTVKDFNNITGAQFAIEYNNDVLVFQDLAVTPAGLPFNFNFNEVNGDLRMTFFQSNTNPVTLPDNTVIAELTFLISQSGDYDLAFADDSVMPKVVVANGCDLAGGIFNTNIPSGDKVISGQIIYKDGTPMPNVEVTCKFDVYSLETTTDSDGNYQFDNLPAGESYTISAFSDENPEEGVTIFDVAKGACHILAVNTLQSADEFIAFDVNNSGTNTTFDLVNMRKMILGQDLGSGISIWHFIGNYDDLPNDFNALSQYETNIQIDNLVDDALNQNFTAIKAGDIVPETNPTAAYNPSFELEEITVNDQTVVLDLTVQDFENIRGIQFALEWDTDILEFSDLEQLASPAPGINLNWDFNIVDGNLRLIFQEYLSNDGLTFPDGTALLRLTFNVLELGNTEVAFADDSVMPKLVVANFCDLAGGTFNFTNTPINLLSSTNDLALSGLTAELRPNLSPSNSKINLVIEAENNTDIQYRIVNISGQEINYGKANLVTGENTISLISPENAGLYILQIQDEEGRIGQLKLVVQ